MAEDKDKILETPEVPEVEAIVEEGVDTAPEVTEEEILVVSETDKPSPADEPVESGETITEQEVEAPVAELKDDFITDKEATEEPKVSQYNYADEPFLADNRVKSGITPKWNWGAMAMPLWCSESLLPRFAQFTCGYSLAWLDFWYCLGYCFRSQWRTLGATKSRQSLP